MQKKCTMVNIASEHFLKCIWHFQVKIAIMYFVIVLLMSSMEIQHVSNIWWTKLVLVLVLVSYFYVLCAYLLFLVIIVLLDYDLSVFG